MLPTENPKRGHHPVLAMRPRAQWFIYLTAIVCSVLAILGGVSYPLNTQGLPYIILYELGLFVGVFSLLLLIYHKALPEG
ncbi:MAG: hypothetical protein ACE5H4_09555 [Candidatus Thorarchaeota archaeon]